MRPDEEIAGVLAGQAALDRTIVALTADELAKPSRLPDWTIAHVLAHLARNADSVVRRLQGAIDNEIVDQYAGGAAGRAAEIEQSARLPLAELAAYVIESSAEVAKICAAVPDDAWDRVSRSVSGADQPARMVVYSRWREVEIHHVDLGLAYAAADWPDGFVARLGPEVLAELAGRADPKQLLAWGIGRAPAPEVGPWG